MNKKFYANNFWLVIGFCFVCVLPYSDAFAAGRDRNRNRDRSREAITVGHERYNYRNGRFYRPGWFGLEFAIFAPPVGAVVSFLPAGHRTIIARGATYYYYDNVHYRACPGGYIVVPAPIVNSNAVSTSYVIMQSERSSNETVAINVPNANGSYTAVTLAKRNNGYVGPQGEYYSGHPTVEQLKALYGK